MPRKLSAAFAPSLRLGACLVATLLTAGCNWYYYDTPSIDAIWYQVPWFDHMIAQRSVHPYSRADIPRYVVPGTVPITGGERDWRMGDPLGASYGFDSTVAKRLANPTDRRATARGDTLYHTFCAVCHGVDGNSADATVGPKLAAPSLLTDRARSYADGYLYSMVRYGRGIMPQYGDKITRPADRWAIVNYVRQLQATAPAVVTGTTGGTR